MTEQDLTDDWNLGEVLAVVQNPGELQAPETDWRADALKAVAIPGYALATAIVKALDRREHNADVVLVSVADARTLRNRGLLFFPEGGPLVGQVYAQHPLRIRDYLPYADYHRILLHERSIEMARYLLSLGARDVSISWRDATGKRRGASADVETPTPLDISAAMGMSREDNGDLSIRITGAGQQRPLPDDLIWPAADPVFKLAKDASAGETFHFGLRGYRSTSVNAKAAVRLEKSLGVSLGGEYKRWEDLTFAIDARFHAGVPRGVEQGEVDGTPEVQAHA